jgi:hypothetical protein
MRRIAALIALVAAGCLPRTEILVGILTDLDAPGALDHVHLQLVQPDTLVPYDMPADWDIPGTATGQFVLPGSYGLYTADGSARRVRVDLTGSLAGQNVVKRSSIVGLVAEETLFMRMALVAGCTAASCSEDDGFTCVEGECRVMELDARRLPRFADALVDHLQCPSGPDYKRTADKTDVPLLGNGGCAPGQYCEEGTCYDKLLPDGGVGSGAWAVEATPANASLSAITGIANGGGFDVYAVGRLGTVLRAAATEPGVWALESAGVADLFGVFGASADDVWAVGAAGALVHRTGGAWSTVASGTLRRLAAVWGASASDVWAVGDGATALHFDGVSWRTVALPGVAKPDLAAVWGSSASDVWAVGAQKSVFHFDGGVWTAVKVDGNNVDYRGVWARAPGSAWVVGLGGTVVRVGTSPGSEDSTVTAALRGVAGFSTGTLFAVGAEGTIVTSSGDGRWTPVDSTVATGLNAVWGSSENDVYAVGQAGVIVHQGVAARADAGVDLSAPDLARPTAIGNPCTKDSDCQDGPTPVCFTSTFGNTTNGVPTPGGYCSSACTGDSQCRGGICQDFTSIGSFCIRTCAAASDCRSGYSCLVQGGCVPTPAGLDCDPTSGNGVCLASPNPAGCIRQVLGSGMTGVCFDACDVGTATCPTIGSYHQHCVVIDTTARGDRWKGPICAGLLTNAVADGAPCLDPNVPGVYAAEVCSDGSECDLAGDKRCHPLCNQGSPSKTIGVPDGGAVAGACTTGSCKDVWGLFATSYPIGLCE